MLNTKRDFLTEMMFRNASENAGRMGFKQRFTVKGESISATYADGSCGTPDAEKTDFSLKTMLECGLIPEDALREAARIISAFPEGSQLVFTHSFDERSCYEILSPYGMKIFEHVNMNAVAKHFGEEAEEGDNCFFCLAVKI